MYEGIIISTISFAIEIKLFAEYFPVYLYLIVLYFSQKNKFIVDMWFKFGLALVQVFRPQYVASSFFPLWTLFIPRNFTEGLAKLVVLVLVK
jgi:hypothetical protein